VQALLLRFNLILAFTLFSSCGKHTQESSSREGISQIRTLTNPDELSEKILNEDLNFLQGYLENGGNPDLEFSTGRTLLTEACLWQKYKVIELLIRFKADPSHVDKLGKSPNDYADQDRQIKRILFPELTLELKRKLFLSVRDKDLTLLKSLLDEIPPVNFILSEQELLPQDQASLGETLLTYAVKKKAENPIRLLASRFQELELDVHQKNLRGESPLFLARSLGFKNIEKTLLKLGAVE